MIHPDAMHVYTADPVNTGTHLGVLRQRFLTPNDQFFIRNHGDVPQVDPDAYRLHVEGMVARPLALSLAELRALPAHSVAMTLQCAGSRRRELNALQPIDPAEIVWDADAIGTAIWTGARLADVLGAAGVQPGAAHAAFAGLDEAHKTQDVFGGSIPIDKALEADVLLAYAMNGEPIPPAHGFPVRVIVPGYIGARSVKWLALVRLQAESSSNYFQTRAYRHFPPEVLRPEDAVWDDAPELGVLPLNSVICAPQDGAALAAGQVAVEGFALTGTGARIARVEVSCDDGATWREAAIIEREGAWAWCFWRADVELAPGAHILVVRAFDTAGNAQPQDIGAVWNFKGYLNNAPHRVRVTTA
jgi:sulfite oxidase